MTRAWRLLAVAVLACGIVLIGAVAWAYWTTGGSGSGSATAGTLAAPATVTATASPASESSATVSVSWTAVIAPNGGAVTGYYVQRYLGATPSKACGSDAGTLLPASPTSCSDTSVPDGTYTYTVIASFG